MIDRDLPLKREISDNIKRLMKERGWTQLKLSDVSGISKSTLSDYINCKTLINPGNVEKLSEAFNVPKYDIDPSFKRTDILKEEAQLYEIPNFTSIPIVGSISCGNGSLAFQDIEGYEETPKSWLNGGRFFYLRAKGDSMINARISEGDLLLIREQEEVENGEIAAVQIDGEAVLKRVFKSGNTLILQSENPKYEPIIVDGSKNIQIIGKLKKVVLNF
ncbi:helix-turn-helix domain-containing protein [Bacillus sp. FJAT-49705]|uniref:Helix-turn-helix domain-containing protein n=1 Tax=Cytobacillus citreus TaxID=2833586 RepID=A0ABS5NVD6_9BACI|nr:LexA family transcriptional regulator [Cytobacillus citreus]MBS4191784.1 helix-turn-helix domain-containing protein [Cytobacillus citreus]